MSNLETQKIVNEGEVETVASLNAEISKNEQLSMQILRDIDKVKKNNEGLDASQVAGKLKALETFLDEAVEKDFHLLLKRNNLQEELSKAKLTGKEADERYSVVSLEDQFDIALRGTGEMADADRLDVRRGN